MNAKKILTIAAVALAVVAIVFRVKAVQKIVTGIE